MIRRRSPSSARIRGQGKNPKRADDDKAKRRPLRNSLSPPQRTTRKEQETCADKCRRDGEGLKDRPRLPQRANTKGGMRRTLKGLRPSDLDPHLYLNRAMGHLTVFGPAVVALGMDKD